MISLELTFPQMLGAILLYVLYKETIKFGFKKLVKYMAVVRQRSRRHNETITTGDQSEIHQNNQNRA